MEVDRLTSELSVLNTQFTVLKKEKELREGGLQLKERENEREKETLFLLQIFPGDENTRSRAERDLKKARQALEKAEHRLLTESQKAAATEVHLHTALSFETFQVSSHLLSPRRNLQARVEQSQKEIDRLTQALEKAEREVENYKKKMELNLDKMSECQVFFFILFSPLLNSHTLTFPFLCLDSSFLHSSLMFSHEPNSHCFI
jgi:signal transduction protein with GAF and PtsI domain